MNHGCSSFSFFFSISRGFFIINFFFRVFLCSYVFLYFRLFFRAKILHLCLPPCPPHLLPVDTPLPEIRGLWSLPQKRHLSRTIRPIFPSSLYLMVMNSNKRIPERDHREYTKKQRRTSLRKIMANNKHVVRL